MVSCLCKAKFQHALRGLEMFMSKQWFIILVVTVTNFTYLKPLVLNTQTYKELWLHNCGQMIVVTNCFGLYGAFAMMYKYSFRILPWIIWKNEVRVDEYQNIPTKIKETRHDLCHIDLEQILRGNVWENQRGAPACRRNLCSYSGYQKYSWIQGPWAIWTLYSWVLLITRVWA